MARKAFSATEFVKEHRASQAQVKKGEAKICTAKGCPCGNVPLKLDAFYRDKSQAGGRSPWCKAKERAYNAAYYAALKDKDVAAPRKKDIEDAGGVAKFERKMQNERVARGTQKKRTATAKATTKARKATRRAKASV